MKAAIHNGVKIPETLSRIAVLSLMGWAVFASEISKISSQLCAMQLDLKHYFKGLDIIALFLGDDYDSCWSGAVSDSLSEYTLYCSAIKLNNR
jgi:hypothetical protein